jgi:hypothetical protein
VKVARFVVDVSNSWQVRIVRPAAGTAAGVPGAVIAPLASPMLASLAPARALRRVTTAQNGDFPMPPEAIAAADPHHALCSDATGGLAAQLYERVVKRGLEPGDVERYGRWLFDALLGEDGFAAVRNVAAAEGADLVELALRWDASEQALSRLHWEAMRSRAGFLAAGRGLRVAVTRVVAGAMHVPRAMASPPRALFVLGGSAGDKDLRPGAELIAVLRPLRYEERSLRGEVLARATPSRLRAAVARLAPDVVHVVAHGVVAHGTCLLELAADEGESDGLRSAEQLLAMLGDATAGLPPVLVLSACDAGLALPLAQAGALAAQLVEKGLPIVIGMAGRVADIACRLFARRFGEALLAGEPLVAATEEGRRAAFSDGDPPDRAIDWALPALFLAEGVAPNFGSQPTPDDPIETRVAAYRVAGTPVFCGRHEVLDALHEVLARKLHPVLAIASREADIGRTRALKELTATALRAGHVPCLLIWESPAAAVPTSVEALARQLGAAVARTRATFGLAPRAVSPLVLLLSAPLEALRAHPQLPAALRAHLAFAETVDAAAFALALADDLGALASDARAADAASPLRTLHAASRAVVLVDDVHRWDKALEPFLDVMLTAWGLGTEAEPVPVVLTFSLDSPAATLLRPISERRRQGWSTVQIDRFSDGEDLLAYEQVLLHPFGPVLPRFSDQRWVFDFDVDEDVVRESVEAFQDVIAGAPGKLGEREFYVLARMAKASGFVVAAGDEDVLEKLRKGSP